MTKTPSYHGTGLVNLVAEIEHRMTGDSRSPRLADPSLVPDAETYVIVLFDGLGVAQLNHPAARSFVGASVAELEAPFPTTTNV